MDTVKTEIQKALEINSKMINRDTVKNIVVILERMKNDYADRVQQLKENVLTTCGSDFLMDYFLESVKKEKVVKMIDTYLKNFNSENFDYDEFLDYLIGDTKDNIQHLLRSNISKAVRTETEGELILNKEIIMALLRYSEVENETLKFLFQIIRYVK